MIAIIAILAAILFPVFGRARENARRSSCLSNLKQIGLGVHQYTQDFDERFPLAVYQSTGSATSPLPFGWADTIQPYLKSTQIYQCPSEGDAVPAQSSNPRLGGYTDYWYNALLSWNKNLAGAQSYNDSVSIAELSNSSLTILLGDGESNSFAGTSGPMSTGAYRANGCAVAGINASSAFGQASFGNCTTPGLVSAAGLGGVKGSGGAPVAHLWHLSGLNLSYADGHAKWSKGNEDATSGSDRGSATIQNPRTGFNTSGTNPTFNLSFETNQ